MSKDGKLKIVTYDASPTLALFHASSKKYRCVRGPVGSGKSTGMCMEIMMKALNQPVCSDGIRRKSRWAIVRNTYRQLLDTTLKTWLDWFPEAVFGKLNKNEMVQTISIPLPDKTILYMEVLFRALDRPDHVTKVESLELTGAWINEAKNIPKAIIDAVGDRVGRYPAIRDGGSTWTGVFMDTNAPDDHHWWYALETKDADQLERYKIKAEDLDAQWDFFVQPGGLIEVGSKFLPNPDAENLKHLETGYYITRVAGKSMDHVRVYYCNQFGFVADGKPVYPEYVDAVHCAHEPLKPMPGLPIYIGLDFGLTPAAVMGQRLSSGRIIVLDEVVSDDMGVSQFADIVLPYVNEIYSGYEIIWRGDPAGGIRHETDAKCSFDILRTKGIDVQPAAQNNTPTLRRQSVSVPMSRLVDGVPGLMLSPKARTVRRALKGGFHYRMLMVGGGSSRYAEKPEKNLYSHPAEALEYMCMGMGEGSRIRHGESKLAGYRPNDARRRRLG